MCVCWCVYGCVCKPILCTIRSRRISVEVAVSVAMCRFAVCAALCVAMHQRTMHHPFPCPPLFLSLAPSRSPFLALPVPLSLSCPLALSFFLFLFTSLSLALSLALSLSLVRAQDIALSQTYTYTGVSGRGASAERTAARGRQDVCQMWTC